MKKKGIILGALGAGMVLALSGLVGVFYGSSVPRESRFVKKKKEGYYSDDAEKQAAYDEAKQWYDGVEKENVEVCSFDGLRLHGIFLPAKRYTTNTVVLVHGYRVSGFKDFGLMLPFYHNLGVNILMPDDRGHGESEGGYVGFGWHDHYDVGKWIDYLLLRFGTRANIFLHGVSMGAATVMMSAGEDLPEQVRGIIEDCGYTTIGEQFKYHLKGKKIPGFPILTISSLITKKKAGYRFSDCNALKALKKAKVPMLFIHGEEDRYVPTKMAYKNFEACASEDKELIIIEGAKHAENYYVDSDTYETVVEDFINRHIV